MFTRVILTAILALGMTTGFSETLKTGRPDAYTRGINPNAPAVAMTGEKAVGSTMKIGRPESYTRGIVGVTLNPRAEAEAMGTKAQSIQAKTGRPEAYTRGIGTADDSGMEGMTLKLEK